jgi:hypothetical protein
MRCGLSFGLALGLLAGFAVPMPASAQANTITVSGVGTAATRPNLATVEVGVEAVNTNLQASFATVNQTQVAIIAVLTEQGIAPTDVQLLGLTVAPEDRIEPRIGPSGNFIYRVRSIMRVTIRDVSKVGPLLTGVVSAGANIVTNFAFGLQDIRTAEQAARAAAVADARARAEALAQALDVVVGDPIIANEIVTTTALPAPVDSNNRGATLGEGDSPINTGQFIVTVQVQVTFTLRIAAPRS